MQRSTDSGVTWSSPLALDDDNAQDFYPQLSVAPNGRIDVAWQDNHETTDYYFDVRYTYSTDGGLTWAKNVKVNDQPLDFNHGVSYNSDFRYPVGVASANSYAMAAIFGGLVVASIVLLLVMQMRKRGGGAGSGGGSRSTSKAPAARRIARTDV